MKTNVETIDLSIKDQVLQILHCKENELSSSQKEALELRTNNLQKEIKSWKTVRDIAWIIGNMEINQYP